MRGESFLTANISSFTQALESIVVTEDLCRAPGLLQGLDPRVKVITLVIFIILVGLAQSLAVLILIFAFALICVLLSKIPRVLFLKRLFIFIPIFTAVIAFPALFITPGVPLLSVAGKTVITEQGGVYGGLSCHEGYGLAFTEFAAGAYHALGQIACGAALAAFAVADCGSPRHDVPLYISAPAYNQCHVPGRRSRIIGGFRGR